MPDDQSLDPGRQGNGDAKSLAKPPKSAMEASIRIRVRIVLSAWAFEGASPHRRRRTSIGPTCCRPLPRHHPWVRRSCIPVPLATTSIDHQSITNQTIPEHPDKGNNTCARQMKLLRYNLVSKHPTTRLSGIPIYCDTNRHRYASSVDSSIARVASIYQPWRHKAGVVNEVTESVTMQLE